MASRLFIHCPNCKSSCINFPMPVSQIKHLMTGDERCKKLALRIITGELIYGVCMKQKSLINIPF